MYNILLTMPKTQSENSFRKNKSIKNVYIHKINSLMKVLGDSQTSLPYLNKARKTICSESREQLLFQRKENNKDAARKARLRKKIYIQLLEQAITNLQQLNELGNNIQKISTEVMETLKVPKIVKQEDQIGQYLIQVQTEKLKMDTSQVTLDSQKNCELKKIVCQIENLSYPTNWSSNKLPNIMQNSQNFLNHSRMQAIHEQLPQIFENLKNICSQHNQLLAISCCKSSQSHFDPYFGKTLMQQYYSKTLCKKNVANVQVFDTLNLLTKMDKYMVRSQKISQSNFLQSQ